MVTPTFQYPHFLYRKEIKESQQLPTGSWTKATTEWKLSSACREETNGKGTQINTADGRVLAFSSLVQLPRGTKRIDEGVDIIITTEKVTPEQLNDDDFIVTAKQTGVIQAQGKTLKFDQNRLHGRIWI